MFPRVLSVWKDFSNDAFKFHIHFYTVAIISCPFFTEYVSSNNMFYQLRNFEARECSYLEMHNC